MPYKKKAGRQSVVVPKGSTIVVIKPSAGSPRKPSRSRWPKKGGRR